MCMCVCVVFKVKLEIKNATNGFRLGHNLFLAAMFIIQLRKGKARFLTYFDIKLKTAHYIEVNK